MKFLRYMNDIFEGDEVVIAFMQRVLGYCLTGETKEHKFFVLQGESGNGKSVLIGVMKHMFNEHFMFVDNSSLLKPKSYDQANPMILKARECRGIFLNETNKGDKLNAALVKQIAAGNEISVRAFHKDHENFVPHFKILLVTNHIPVIDYTDGGMLRRLVIISFNKQISEDNADKDLEQALLQEREGILKWLIDGAVDYYRQGLAIPDKIRNVVNTLRVRNDTVYAFKQDEISQAEDSNVILPSSFIYQQYTKYCCKNGVEPVSQKAFSQKFMELGIQLKRGRAHNGFSGIKLKRQNNSTAADAIA